MTKKELERLHSDKAQIEKAPSKHNTYIVHMSLTEGELLALKNSLETEPTYVGSDVRDYLNNALRKAGVTFY